MKIKFFYGLLFFVFLSSQKITAAEESKMDDVFLMSIGELMNISVSTASKYEEKMANAPGVISVITQDELLRFKATSLKKALEMVPGLSGTTSYLLDRSMISIRGDSVSTHSLLLINGRPVRETLDSNTKSDIFETFPVSIIEKIEVVKGPGSVLYGSNAFSGIINVVTKKATKNSIAITPISGVVNSSYGVEGSTIIQAGDFNVIAAVKNFKKPEWNTFYSYIHPVTGLLTSEVAIPNYGTGAYGEVEYKNLKFMTSYDYWSTFYGSSRGFGRGETSKYFTNLGYSTDINSMWSSSIDFTYTQAKGYTSSYPSIKRNSNEGVIEWNNILNVNERTKLSLGSSYNTTYAIENTTFGGVDIIDIRAQRWAMAFYGQVNYNLLDKVDLIGGVQANKIQNINLDVVSRAGAIWHIDKNLYVKGLFGEAFRAPTMLELSLNHPAPTAPKGNPDLEPEKVRSFDLSVGYHGDHAQVALNYFYTKQSNVIMVDRSNVPPRYSSIGGLYTQGLELEGKGYLNNEFMLVGSTLLQKNNDTNGVKDVLPVANFGAKLGVSYKSNANGVTLSLFNVFQGKLNNKFNSSTANDSPTEYNIVNFNGSAELNKLFKFNSAFTFTPILQVDNMFDKKIWLPATGYGNDKSIPYDQGRVMFAGMTIAYTF